ncbi:hypothetical protein DUNSADRAFT_5765 [Dunaliella salina]|uniref:Encoded protein n=1 Tax=Dunaliella salina TaxID=3046 RepID=A0ABQ7H768_DUNSA|nr:hypothetical protein DUNSADRAFT_5765 [Dunaliella salina]|eukprot:KAF5842689.1 hypothetical protein DUNSADRAFT_5765 [Dunaliella salina]
MQAKSDPAWTFTLHVCLAQRWPFAGCTPVLCRVRVRQLMRQRAFVCHRQVWSVRPAACTTLGVLQKRL